MHRPRRVRKNRTSSSWTCGCPRPTDYRRPGESVAEPATTKVLTLTTSGRAENDFEALRAAASGFLLTDPRRGEIIAAIRTVAEGDRLLFPSITHRLIENCLRLPDPGTRPALLECRTERERTLRELLARGMSNAEIAGTLVMSSTTVTTSLTHLSAQLGVRDRLQAVIPPAEVGLVAPGAGRSRPG